MTLVNDKASSTRRRKTTNHAITAASSHLDLPDGNEGSASFESSVSSDEENNGRSLPLHTSNTLRSNKSGKRRRKRKKGHDQDDGSFLCLFLRTGSVIAFLWLASWSIYRHFVPYEDPNLSLNIDDDYFNPPPKVAQEPPSKPLIPAAQSKDTNLIPATAVVETIPPTLPAVTLSERALHWDAFAVAARRSAAIKTTSSTKNQTTALLSNQQQTTFWDTAQAIRQDFVDLYGNQDTARALLDRGLTLQNNGNGNHAVSSSSSMPMDLQQTACRLRHAQQEERPFRMAFGGYSVTVGRGNYFHQSYPMVLERILHAAFLDAGGLSLQVTNAAIGGCPSFPYGWCLSSFLGTTPDVVSWDFAMNEAGGDPQGLEAYLRRVWHDLRPKAATNINNKKQPNMQAPPPQIIVRDTPLATERHALLQNYSRWFPDAVTLHSEPAAEPYLELPDAFRPKGFMEWRKFGAPKGAPGQALHHPAVAEHQLMAYLLAIHYLAALEIMVFQQELDDTMKDHPLYLSCPAPIEEKSLPPPWTWNTDFVSGKEHPWQSTFVGDATNDWQMTDMACRTSFEPIEQGNLTPLVVAGSQGEDLDILKPRSKMFYNKGWTLDLAHEEKQAKKNLLRYGGLGFIDSKKAYYGIEMSGWLRLLLPIDQADAHVEPDKTAKEWFRSVILCEVNDKTTSGYHMDKGPRCKMDKDVEYWVGGVNVTASAKPIDAGGALYLGKKVCIHLPVPPVARTTTAIDLFEKAANGDPMVEVNMTEAEEEEQQQQEYDHLVRLPEKDGESPTVGLSVEIRVSNPHIFQIEQACSISHVVWELANMHQTGLEKQ